MVRSLIRGARRLKAKGEDLALAGALFGGAGCLVAAGWMVAPPAGISVLGVLLIVAAVLRVAGTGGEQ